MKKSSLALKMTTFVVLTMCFLFLIGGSLVLKNVNHVLTSWGQDLQMTIYLDQAQTEEQRNQIIQKLSRYPDVESTRYVPQEKALEQFRVQMAEYAPDLLNDPELIQMIPSSLLVKFKSEVQGNEQLQIMKTIHQDLKNEKIVDEVSYGQEWVQKYTQINGFFSDLVIILGVSLSAAALFVISNVIQTSIRQRRAEIEVLELLGATASTIRRPFLVEGVKIGLLSIALALFLNWSVLQFILTQYAGTLALLKITDAIQFLDFKNILFFLAMGPLLGALASYICLRKINTGWAAAGRRV
ncbi:MAG: permease-like cell division protein FtsX [Bdellovibrionota bacterium]